MAQESGYAGVRREFETLLDWAEDTNDQVALNEFVSKLRRDYYERLKAEFRERLEKDKLIEVQQVSAPQYNYAIFGELTEDEKKLLTGKPIVVGASKDAKSKAEEEKNKEVKENRSFERHLLGYDDADKLYALPEARNNREYFETIKDLSLGDLQKIDRKELSDSNVRVLDAFIKIQTDMDRFASRRVIDEFDKAYKTFSQYSNAMLLKMLRNDIDVERLAISARAAFERVMLEKGLLTIAGVSPKNQVASGESSSEQSSDFVFEDGSSQQPKSSRRS